jgi:8-oxo-dGTP diphosphatase
LQGLYEAILGVRFDRRNFAAKMLKLGLLSPVGDRPAHAARRIPQTYCFNAEKYNQLKQSGFRLEF